nr:response regulator [Deltaproteobacteria bacterium]
METILIVDDSSTVRKFLTATLKTRNFRCIEASDGFDALEKLAQNPQIRLIISDLNMPNMDGI